ncbi:MAG: hypothetical protein LQ346_000093 [Caloplaca aetnensis]|nr:MAG: hypothetical protein LQ346_000093 [Caloplaca aetnensis]
MALARTMMALSPSSGSQSVLTSPVANTWKGEFQYVSLLRFASKTHEKFSSSEKELNSWKDREKSIVTCLAATESLGRVLHIARDQLLELGGDVSVIDDVLHCAASLNGINAVATGKDSNSATDHSHSHTFFGDQHPPAGSMLARGSAADLQNIRDDILQPHSQDLPRAARINGLEHTRHSKRKRLDTTNDNANSYQHDLVINERQQRLSSRDAMPPPAQLLQDTSWTKVGRPAASRQLQSLDYNPGRHYDYAELIEGDNYSHLNGQPPMFKRMTVSLTETSASLFHLAWKAV